MSKFKLVASLVPHNKAELISNAAAASGSWGGTVLLGRKCGGKGLLSVLGLDERTVEIVLILLEETKKEQITQAIIGAASSQRQNFGILCTLDADTFLRSGNISGGDCTMAETHENTLISVILNKGYADDAMAAARKAGAGGGTVINARGTAREDDEKFFGVHIVPEKEMLLIVVPDAKKAAVIDSIKNLGCLQRAGSGIAFCAGLEDFTVLGKK